MSNIILTGIKTKLQWKMKFERADEKYHPKANMLTMNPGGWTAWPVDEQVDESGAPVLYASNIEDLVDQIQLFEQGADYGH